MYWKENGRVVVQVDMFDATGRLRHEKFFRPTSNPEQALQVVAQLLAQRGLSGEPRVRQRTGNSLLSNEALRQRFLQTLNQASKPPSPK